VDVHLAAGGTLTGSTEIVRGDAANPVPWPELLAKFRHLASRRLDPARVETVHESVLDIEGIDDVARLHDALSGS
jgi:hypothetical protein